MRFIGNFDEREMENMKSCCNLLPDLWIIILPAGWTLQRLGGLSVTGLGGEQVLQASVNGMKGLPPLLEHK